MNSFNSHPFTKSFGVVVAVGVMGALTTPQTFAQGVATPASPPPVRPTETRFTPPPPAPPTPEDALAFLRLDQTNKVCNQSIAFNVENATLDDIVARVQKALATAKMSSKVPIEVRGAKPVRLSFSTQNATVGSVLGSVAMLADVQFWVFSDHLLLAPVEALTPAEQEAKTKGFATKEEFSSDVFMQLQAQRQKNWAYSTFVGNELKELKPSPTTNTTAPTQAGRDGHSLGVVTSAAFGQLSPESKAMMQELLTMTQFPANRLFPPPSLSGFTELSLSPSSDVAILSGENKHLEVVINGSQQRQWTITWGLQEGSPTVIRSQNSSPSQEKPQQPTRPQVTPFDPSAGGS